MSDNPIGVFDSGIGGLSTLKAMRQQLPAEHFIYVADQAWSPYGSKPVELLQQRADALCRFLIQRHAKAIVVACNTATAAAVASLRENYSLPIIGVEPGIKPATRSSLAGVVGILATERTIASQKFRNLLGQFDDKHQIIVQACPGLADAIEAGSSHKALRTQLLKGFLQPLLERGVDTLVLGCTHYPLIADEIRALVPADVQLVDTSAAIAAQVVAQLQRNGILNTANNGGAAVYFTSSRAAAGAQLNEIFSAYLEEPVYVDVLPE